jgi:hypothetical protein
MGRHRRRTGEALFRQALPLLRPPWQAAPQLHDARNWRREDHTYNRIHITEASARPSAEDSPAGVSPFGKSTTSAESCRGFSVPRNASKRISRKSASL